MLLSLGFNSRRLSDGARSLVLEPWGVTAGATHGSRRGVDACRPFQRLRHALGLPATPEPDAGPARSAQARTPTLPKQKTS
jgi:hypothetical protein